MANHTSGLQRWLESIWYAKKGSDWRYLPLMPLSYLYCLINRLQRFVYTKNTPPLACPVIVVGNITVGGTGKTPLTIHIVKQLKQAGYQPAIITRGYGGKASTWPQAVSANSDPALVGDEAVLMASHTNVPVYAGADRLASIAALQQQHDCDVIVADDGMQHYKLPRDIQIAVIDGARQLGNQQCLPAGPLREPKHRLHACDFIVINGKQADAQEYPNPPQARFEMTLQGERLVNLATGLTQPLHDFRGKTIQAVTGIGNPQRFYASLTAAGLQVIEHSFPDHYAFTANDVAFGADDMVIVTEKDAVKCKPLLGDSSNVWVLPVTACLDNRFDQALLQLLEGKIAEK